MTNKPNFRTINSCTNCEHSRCYASEDGIDPDRVCLKGSLPPLDDDEYEQFEYWINNNLVNDRSICDNWKTFND